jgi:hypothetical protein
MQRPSKDLVERTLAIDGRGEACRRAVEKAWNIVGAKYPDAAWWRRKSTRRSLMWEHSVESAISALGDLPGVRVISHHDTASFLFDDIVLLRFKKASLELRTSNYPTFLAQLFHQHENDLFGHQGFHRVELVHVFNRFETGLDWIGVVAREKRRVLWKLELGSGGANVMELRPQKPLSPAGDRVLRPVKPAEDESVDKD